MIKILLIVEGILDQLLLNSITKLFDEKQVEIESVNGDLLKNKDFVNSYENIVSEKLSKEKIFNLEDFNEICFVTDTDGCFIDEENIIIDENNKAIKYNDYSIICSNTSVKEELKIKSNNIKKIINNNVFYIYYNSCNLEHAFGGERNNTSTEKKKFALWFTKRYYNRINDFLSLLISINHAETIDYKESWNYIIKDCNSLNSSSNIIIFLFQHINLLKKEYKNILLNEQ